MIFNIDPPFWQIAREEALIRHSIGDSIRSSSQKRGNLELELLIDMSGIIGELIAAEILSGIFSSVDSSSLRDYTNFKRPDIVVDGNIAIDIKAVPEGNNRKYFVVNKRAHKDSKKRSDFYLPIKIIDKSKAMVYDPITHQTVSTWPNNPNICRYEEGHCMLLSNMKEATPESIERIINYKKLLDLI